MLLVNRTYLAEMDQKTTQQAANIRNAARAGKLLGSTSGKQGSSNVKIFLKWNRWKLGLIYLMHFYPTLPSRSSGKCTFYCLFTVLTITQRSSSGGDTMTDPRSGKFHDKEKSEPEFHEIYSYTLNTLIHFPVSIAGCMNLDAVMLGQQ